MPTSNSGLAEQFHDLAQQHQADRLGMWLFLATELMLFGGWFTGLIISRIVYSTGFGAAAGHLDLLLGTGNLAVLLTSSLAVTLAAKTAAVAQRKATLGFLLVTMALGTLYLAVQAYEWYGLIQQQLMPWLGLPFRFPGQHVPAAEAFFNYYFLLTGLHSIHLLIGLAILALFSATAMSQHKSGTLARRVEIAGLYWVFLSVIAVFIYILLYLLRS